jgi:hypothetical protein
MVVGCSLIPGSGFHAVNLTDPQRNADISGEWASLLGWSYIDAGQPSLGIQYSMLGFTRCQPTPLNALQAVVQFVCAAEPGTMKAFRGADADTCMVYFMIPTPIACPTRKALFPQQPNQVETS